MAVPPPSCPQCQAPLRIQWGRRGSFLACTAYPQCQFTGAYHRAQDGTVELVAAERSDLPCPVCDGAMTMRAGSHGSFLACLRYPTCKGTRPPSMGVDCPRCQQSYLTERHSKKGRVFYGCADYPQCDFSLWDRPISGSCPDCGSGYLIIPRGSKAEGEARCPDATCGFVTNVTALDPELGFLLR